MATPVALRVLTLNCWGVPGTPRRRARLEAIGLALRHRAYDVVCLQEVWLGSDVARIVSLASPALPHSHWFCGGFVGSGLLTLSAHPIVATAFHRFTVNGTPWDVAGADWFGAKGVGLVRVELSSSARDEAGSGSAPGGGGRSVRVVDVYNTHLIARYDGWAKLGPVDDGVDVEDYRAHRLAQALEVATFVRCVSGEEQSIKGVMTTVVAGDLNATADQEELKVLRALAGLSDAAAEGATCCGSNTWAHKEDAACPRRLDYVLVGLGGSTCNAAVCMRHVGEDGATQEEVDATCSVLPRGTSFSDHFGVSATVQANPWTITSQSENPSLLVTEIEEVASTLRRVFDVGIRMADVRRRRHMGHAVLCVAAWAVCLWTRALHSTPLALGLLSFGAATYATVHVLVAVLHGLDERNGLLHAHSHAQRLAR